MGWAGDTNWGMMMMHKTIGLIVIIFGAAGIILVALDWILQQGRPYPKGYKAKRSLRANPPGQEKAAEHFAQGEGEGGKPAAEPGPPGEAAEAAAVICEKGGDGDSPLAGNEEKRNPGAVMAHSNEWYAGVFPARALIEELSLLNKLREILHSVAEIHEAIRTIVPGFDEESRIAEFIDANNLQYFDVVSRGKHSTVYIKEGCHCSADNDRCIYYKGYVWLNPELVDYNLSPKKEV